MTPSEAGKASWKKRRVKHQAEEYERRKLINDGGSHKPSLPIVKWLEREMPK